MDELMLQQMAERFFAVPAFESFRKVLCVAPHPDDIEIAMGGTVAKMCAEGVVVDFLTVTDGALGDTGLTDGTEPLATVRKREAITAGNLLGVNDFFWLDWPDGEVADATALSRQIGERVRAGQYDAVFCPDPWCAYEAHGDHIVTGKAVAQAAILSGLKHFPPETETDSWNLKAVCFYHTQKVNTVVDVAEYYDTKVQAMAVHQSQIDEATLQMYYGYGLMRGRNLTEGESVGEGFKVLSPLHLHCLPEGADL